MNNTGSKINGGGGIRIDHASTIPLIRNNTILGNSVGLNLLDSPSPTIIYDNILDNKEYNIYLYDNSGSNINATYNWWGTIDPQAINRSIRDFKNDFNLGTVSFVPFLNQSNPNSPVIPEFPSLLFPSLFFVALTLGIVFFRKKGDLRVTSPLTGGSNPTSRTSQKNRWIFGIHLLTKIENQ